MDRVQAAKALINECKTRGYYNKPLPDTNELIESLANELYNKAKEAYDRGQKGEDVTAIVKLGEVMNSIEESPNSTQNDPDENRYNDLVLEEIEGLPNPIQPEGVEQIPPFNLELLTVKEIMRYTGIYNSCFAYANHMYSLEEAGESAAKIIADEAYDVWLVKADKKDPDTNKPKTAKQLEAEAFTEDERYKKWRTKQREHATKAKRFKRLKDIYFEYCERLSRAFTAIQDERKYTNG